MSPTSLTSPATAGPDSVDDRLLDHRVVVLDGELDAAAAERLTSRLLLLALVSPSEPVGVYLTCSGGSAESALRVVAALDLVPCEVTTLALGPVAGAGALVLAAGTHGRRLALASATVSLRSAGAVGMSAGGRSTGWADLLAERTGSSREDLEAAFAEGRAYDASRARDAGLVDVVLTSAASVSPDALPQSASASGPDGPATGTRREGSAAAS